MTPRRREALQGRILDAIKHENPGTTDGMIAAAAGCCRPHVSTWRDGSREMDLSNIMGMIGEFGAKTVLSPLAAEDGAEVIPARRESAQDPDAALYDVHAPLGTLAASLLESMRDGVRTAEERAAMVPTARQLVRELAEWIAAEESRQSTLPLQPRKSA